MFFSLIVDALDRKRSSLKNNFIYFWWCWVFAVLRALSTCSEWGLLSSYGARASHFSGLTCGTQALGLAGLSSCGTWAQLFGAPRLYSTRSIVVAHGLSCPSAHGIFLDQGLNFCLLHWQVDSLPLSHQGSPGKDLERTSNLSCNFSQHPTSFQADKNSSHFVNLQTYSGKLCR